MVTSLVTVVEMIHNIFCFHGYELVTVVEMIYNIFVSMVTYLQIQNVHNIKGMFS